jgi:hypothetical protein
LIISVCLVFLFGAYAETTANLLVYKSIHTKDLVAGKPVHVNVMIFNVGER